jgi:hypothetical protein
MARKTRPEEIVTPRRTLLQEATAALGAGNVRLARQRAAQAAESGPEAEREEARRLLHRLEPDRTALLVVAAVLLLIIIAAWLAILRQH